MSRNNKKRNETNFIDPIIYDILFMNVMNDVRTNPYLVQSSARKEPEYLTTTSWLDTLRGVKFKNVEFNEIQSRFEGLPEEEQLSKYQEINEKIFGWQYFAPYQVLESLKDKEFAWFQVGLKHFYTDEDLSSILVKGYGDKVYRNVLDSPFQEKDRIEQRLKQEKFMTAQFCWWERKIQNKFPEVYSVMQKRFSTNTSSGNPNWLVDGGELKNYILERCLTRGKSSVQGVFPWTYLRDKYGDVTLCEAHSEWYTVWDCNLQIFQKNLMHIFQRNKFNTIQDKIMNSLSIPTISWSYKKPTFGNTKQIWSDIKKKIQDQIQAEYNEVVQRSQVK